MAFRPSSSLSDLERKRVQRQRMLIVHCVLGLVGLVIVSRLMELQLLRGEEYRALAQSQHFGGVVLPAKRGEILSRNSKTGETSLLATNTTLDLVYVDPLVTDDPTFLAEKLSEILVTEEIHTLCSSGSIDCPRELAEFYSAAFDPLQKFQRTVTGTLLEPFPLGPLPILPGNILDSTEVRRRFARWIEERISEKRVTFVPLTYGATKVQMQEVSDMGIPGIFVAHEAKLIYANPEDIEQLRVTSVARKLADVLAIDPAALSRLLRSRHLRYVPVMRRLPPQLSAHIRQILLASNIETLERRKNAPTAEVAQGIINPLRSIALIPEHWRFYPDGTVAAQVVGFLNANSESQYGIERTFDPQLRGQEGLIRTVSDPQGGQILTAEQRVIDPRDGDSIVLTIDRFVQREVERLLIDAVRAYDADSAQVIVMEPKTGRIIAMANAPMFDGNDYGAVYKKVPFEVDAGGRKLIVVEIYHPDTREFIVKAYLDQIFTPEGRQTLSEEKRQDLADLEKLYDLKDVVRYYQYIGETSRREIFPTDRELIWLRYENTLGVGAYLNRAVQEIYEPGSVMKPITMAIAIDQGEVVPSDTYDDKGPVKFDEYTIKNALNRYYDTVSMTDCLAYSINTCMTSVSTKLGKKLFHRKLQAFGFGRITGIELEDELPGEILPWREWSNSLLATAAFGQGVSATPLQMITAFSTLANGGRLMRPMIIDSILRSDGTVETMSSHVMDQVITPEAAETITAMLASGTVYGYAKTGKVPGYRIAGKTGTSQIARPGGGYETGTGSSINSFIGYAPVSDPRFTIIVKFDRTRRGGEFGSETAAPIFRNVAAFLFTYYGIPPTE